MKLELFDDLTMVVDQGITTAENGDFVCYLTDVAYKEMTSLIERFCIFEATGYQLLYEIDCQIDLLFSPGGTW